MGEKQPDTSNEAAEVRATVSREVAQSEGSGEEVVRLHLGCGEKLWDGFINVDIQGDVDVQADLRELPFEEEYADEIHAIHVIEHFYIWEVMDVLRHWRKILKTNGKLFLELPCGEKVIGHAAQAILCGSDPAPAIMFGLYGDYRYKDPLMCHRWLYTSDMMQNLLKEVGFTAVYDEEPKYHVKVRDMRWVAMK